MRPRAAAPRVVQVGATDPRDRHRRQELGGREAGAPDQDVGLVQRAVVGAHAAGLQPGDAPGDHLDVLPGQRGVPVVGEEQPLAADRVVRHQAAAQRPVRHLPAQGEPPGGPHRGDQRPADRGAAGERGVEPLGDPEDRPPLGGQAGRHPTEEPPVPRGVLPVRLRHDVRRAALEDRQRGHPVHDARHELDGAGAGAHHGHPPPGQVDVVAPLRGVEGGAVEVARDGRHHRVGELADRRDQEVRLERAPGRPHVPDAGRLVEAGAEHLGAGAHQVEQALRLGGGPEVGQDLRLAGVAPAPVRVGRPRPGVERRRHVARGVGVGVVAPDAADLVGALQDDHVAQAAAQQLAGHAQAAEARPDDDHPRLGGGTGGCGRRGAHGPRPTGPHAQVMVIPPSTATVWPVMYPAASEARKTTEAASSAGSPLRPTGIRGAWDSR